jgi:hypothetical protein
MVTLRRACFIIKRKEDIPIVISSPQAVDMAFLIRALRGS